LHLSGCFTKLCWMLATSSLNTEEGQWPSASGRASLSRHREHSCVVLGRSFLPAGPASVSGRDAEKNVSHLACCETEMRRIPVCCVYHPLVPPISMGVQTHADDPGDTGH
jgi:hypothetical protein